MVPVGYSCQIGGYNGTLDFISVNRREAMAKTFEMMESAAEAHEPITVVFERIDDRLVLRNGRNKLDALDFAPMYGEEYRHIGIHSYAGSARLRKIRISRMALPRKPSPLVAGDVLLSRGSYQAACETFLRIGRDHPSSRAGRKALVRAYYATRYLENPHADSLRGWIGSVMEREYTGTEEYAAMLFLKAEDHWNAEGAPVAIDCLEKLARNPHGSRYVNYLDPSHIPREYSARATRLLVRSGKRIFLDVSAMLGDSLEILKGASILGLTARSNNITHLEPLRGMALVWLTLDDNRISDLSPVANPRLRLLSAYGNSIKDLSPLRTCKLTNLNLGGNRIEDIAPLADMPLTTLHLGQNRIRDIAPLSRMQLKVVNLEDNRIQDLQPLAGLNARHLLVRGNPVEDFAPLAGLPLRRLSVSGFRQEDLDYLKKARLTSLQIFSGSIRDLSPLEGQPLQSVQLEGCGLTDISWAPRFKLSRMKLRDNRIEDLTPLAGVNISVLDILGNNIKDLSPLEGMKLSSLRCSNNPVKSLGHLVENPPAEFEFWCPTLPEHELLRAIDMWRGKPDLAMHRTQAQTLYYLKTGQADSLKSLAFEVGGNRYLHVKWSAHFHQADSLARLAGGYLWTLSYPTEAARVAEKIAIPRRVWLNAEFRDGRWIWRHPDGDTALLQIAGQNPRFPRLRMRTDLLTQYAVSQRTINGFIIEWRGNHEKDGK
jgi:Leucine-rich repeat (LRR) protein